MAEDNPEDIVTPFNITAGDKGVDYDRLVDKFGCQYVTQDHLAAFQELTG